MHVADFFCRCTCYRVLQSVVDCCRVLQSVAECCRALQWIAVYCMLQSVAECCRVLQCAAVCCSVLQCVAVYCMSHSGVECCRVMQRWVHIAAFICRYKCYSMPLTHTHPRTHTPALPPSLPLSPSFTHTAYKGGGERKKGKSRGRSCSWRSCSAWCALGGTSVRWCFMLKYM